MTDFTDDAIDAMDTAELRTALKATVRRLDETAEDELVYADVVDGGGQVPASLFISMTATIVGVVVEYGQKRICGDHAHYFLPAPRGIDAGDYGLTRERADGENDMLIATPLTNGGHPHGTTG